jgi:bacterioferritin
MKDLDTKKTQKLLSRIMEFELAGVVRYTHYSLMVTGPNRIPIVAFMKAQAGESLLHAQQAGEILTGLGGHPTLQIAPIDETYRHTLRDILEESVAHEKRALNLYKELLDVVEDRSVYLEEFARTQIAQEEMHSLELRKMMRDITVMESPQHAHDAHAHDHHGHDDKPKKADKKSHKKTDRKQAGKRPR